MADVADVVKELVSLVKRARYSFAVWVFCLLVLAVPLPPFLRLDSFRNDYGQYVGIIGLFSLVLWVVEMILFVRDEINRRREAARASLEKEQEAERAEKKLREERQEEAERAEKKLREEKEGKERAVLCHLDSLSRREALIFHTAIAHGSQTVYWPNDDEMGPLIAKGLMERVEIKNDPYNRPYHIPRIVWERIKQPEESEKLMLRSQKTH